MTPRRKPARERGVKLQVQVPPRLAAELRRQARQRALSLSAYVRSLLHAA